MKPLRAWWTLAACGLVVSCGGGGGGGGGGSSGAVTTPPPPGYTLSGTIAVIGDSLADSDVNDPNVARVANDEPGQQQAIGNPATVGGYANEPGTGPAGPSFPAGDEFDAFIAPLAQGQNVNLFVADPSAGDLDLYLFDEALNLVDSSEGTGSDETVTAPAAGTYSIVVFAFGGASNYVLHVGAEAAAASHGMRYSAEFVPGEVITGFRERQARVTLGTSLPARAHALGLEARGGDVGRASLLGLPSPGLPAALRTRPESRAWHRHLPNDARRLTLSAAKALAARSDVEYAEPNLLRHALATPNDPYFGQQWHYTLINLPLAWDITQGSSSVIVAVLDTGVVLNHPDLAGQFDPQDPNGVDFISSLSSARDGDGRDQNAFDVGDGLRAGDSSFHGTHVAGTVAATTSNGSGVAGAGWNTRIMPLRVLGAEGGTSFDIQQAVLYAAGLPNDTGIVPANPADVINLSLGGSSSSASEQQVYTQAVNAGVLVAAAAGNAGGSQVSYPASYTGVVSVAAVNRAKQRAPYSQFNSAVDVAAPGGDQSRSAADGVLSTHATAVSGSPAATLSYLQGTSMAAPHVAAVMALMRAVHPGLTQQNFLDLLAAGTITEDLGTAGRDNSFGYGLIDARKAVVAAANLAGGAPVVAGPALASSNDVLPFGPSLTTLLFDLANVGGGSLTVTGVGDDQPWLSVAADSVRGDGTGRYRATVNRAGLAAGLYEGSITATSSSNSVQIAVTLQVGGAASASAGYTYVLLVDPETFDTVDQFEGPTSSGTRSYSFAGVAAGSYVVIAGSDQNNDGYICDSGESCGAYPTLDVFEPVTVTNAGRSGLDFVDGFALGVNAGAADAGAAPAPRRGWRRLR